MLCTFTRVNNSILLSFYHLSLYKVRLSFIHLILEWCREIAGRAVSLSSVFQCHSRVRRRTAISCSLRPNVPERASAKRLTTSLILTSSRWQAVALLSRSSRAISTPTLGEARVDRIIGSKVVHINRTVLHARST